jgi:phosphoserine phosphatase RsbU/P
MDTLLKADHEERTDRYDLQALYETSRLLSASLDLHFVLGNLLLTAMSKMLVTRGVVLIFDPVEDGYRVAGVKGVRSLSEGDVIPLALEGADAVTELSVHGIEFVMPIVSGHRRLGFLALGSKATRQPFSDREIAFLDSMVQMSGSAVHNALMVGELEQANRDLDTKVQQLNTLFDLSQEFNATIDRRHLVKLFSFALMGQMFVAKYTLLLKRSGTGDADLSFEVAASKGIDEAALSHERRERLCRMPSLQIFDDSEQWADFSALGLHLALPIKHQNETCAVLCLGPKMTGKGFGTDDIELLYALGNLAFTSIQNTYLVDEQIERQRLQEEMKLAQHIQERLLPQELPRLKGVDLAATAIPSREVGGDYYDVIKLEGPRVLTAIADVTGKGAPAAMLMANLQSCLHVMSPMPMSLEEAIGHINRVICKNTDYDKFITFFTGIYHMEERTFTYVNAGHNPPMLVRADGSIELLEKGGLLLGVMSGMPYESGTVTLEPGDSVVMFTDGVTEAMGIAEEEFGEERLEPVLVAHRATSASEILKAIKEAVAEFVGEQAQLSDDFTVLILKVEP